MFTGIIKETGIVKSIKKKANLWQIGVSADKILSDVDKGDSVSVNGVCLTVVDKSQKLILFDVVKTTLDTTNLKRLYASSLVNLESSLKVGDKLSGHFVLGHIDCESCIKSLVKKGEYFIMAVGYNREFSSYIVNKGSIAIDGISLTIQKLDSNFFTASIIPYTFEHTNLKHRRPGEWVNIEFDYLLKKNK